jgi:hypothetical protein
MIASYQMREGVATVVDLLAALPLNATKHLEDPPAIVSPIWRKMHSVEPVKLWPIWRRRHRYRARQNYRRRGDTLPAYLRL